MLGFNNKNEEIEDAKNTGEMGNLDPMSDSPLKNPPADDVEDVEETTVDDISARLSKENNTENAEEEVIEKETPANFDPSMFTPEQMQILKRMLNATPDRPTNKNKGMIVQLREIEGRTIKDFSKAFNGYMQDPEEPSRRLPVVKIKVWFFGQDEPEEMLYTAFMESPRKKFTVLGTRTETEEVEEGETISNETGKLVTMLTVYHHRFFTIEVDGQKVEVSDKIVNA